MWTTQFAQCVSSLYDIQSHTNRFSIQCYQHRNMRTVCNTRARSSQCKNHVDSIAFVCRLRLTHMQSYCCRLFVMCLYISMRVWVYVPVDFILSFTLRSMAGKTIQFTLHVRICRFLLNDYLGVFSLLNFTNHMLLSWK